MLLAAFALLASAAASVAQPLRFFPVGVVYEVAGSSLPPEGGSHDTRLPPKGGSYGRGDLEDIRQLRFNVVAGPTREGQQPPLAFVDRLAAGAPYPNVTLPEDARIAVIPTDAGPHAIAAAAWSAVAEGADGLVFDDWQQLRADADRLAAAAAVADAISTNTAFYAALRPIERTRGTVVEVVQGDLAKASLLRAGDALALIAINDGGRPQEIVLRFPPGTPQAIWRNMLTGDSVSLVSTKEGRILKHRFEPHEVVVLAINTNVQ